MKVAWQVTSLTRIDFLIQHFKSQRERPSSCARSPSHTGVERGGGHSESPLLKEKVQRAGKFEKHTSPRARLWHMVPIRRHRIPWDRIRILTWRREMWRYICDCAHRCPSWYYDGSDDTGRHASNGFNGNCVCAGAASFAQ